MIIELFDEIVFFFSGENNELNAVSAFSEIVPDTVVFDDFERYDIYLYFMRL
jgi:hypothetical protein